MGIVIYGSFDITGEDVIGVLVPSSKLHPIYAVETKEKKIAISFDATWGSTYTPHILNNLARHNIKTTFFLTNIWLEDYPDMAKKIISAGHELGLHSVSHPHMNTLTEAKIAQELNNNAKLIKEITGFDAKLFRPPFGEYNNKVIGTIRGLGYIPIQWSVDSIDWKNGITPQKVVDRVLSKLHPGAIVLFHNNAEPTSNALDKLLSEIKRAGYEIVPISELLYKDNYYIDHRGFQIKKSN